MEGQEMTQVNVKPSRLLLLLGATTLAAMAPVQIARCSGVGLFGLELSLAHAKGGADDKGGDDHGGQRSGSDDHGRDDHGGDDRGNDDHGSDDHGGRSRDDSSSHHRGGDDARARRAGATGTGGSGIVTLAKIEVSATGVEVVYSDGSREEIENGRYERKNAARRTVEQRRATQADLDRLLALR